MSILHLSQLVEIIQFLRSKLPLDWKELRWSKRNIKYKIYCLSPRLLSKRRRYGIVFKRVPHVQHAYFFPVQPIELTWFLVALPLPSILKLLFVVKTHNQMIKRPPAWKRQSCVNYIKLFLWSDIWNVSYIELRVWNQVSYDHRSYERNCV